MAMQRITEPDGSGSARITLLPDALLLHMLGLIGDAKSVFRCALICKRFKQLVYKVPALRFDVPRNEPHFPGSSDSQITSVVMKTVDLRSLSVSCGKWKPWSINTVEAWLLHTGSSLQCFNFHVKGVLEREFLFRLFSCILDHCRSLEQLDVSSHCTLKVDQLAELSMRTPLSSLQILAIQNVDIRNSDQLLLLLRSFPHLRTLHLEPLRNAKRLCIQSPCIQEIRLGGMYECKIESVLIDVPSLERLHLSCVERFSLEHGTSPFEITLDYCLKGSPPPPRAVADLSILLRSQFWPDYNLPMYHWQGSSLAHLLSGYRQNVRHLCLEINKVLGKKVSDYFEVIEAMLDEFPQLRSLEIRRSDIMSWFEKYLATRWGKEDEEDEGIESLKKQQGGEVEVENGAIDDLHASASPELDYNCRFSWMDAPKLESLDVCVRDGSLHTIAVINMFLLSCPNMRMITLRLFWQLRTEPAFFAEWSRLQDEHSYIAFLLLCIEEGGEWVVVKFHNESRGPMYSLNSFKTSYNSDPGLWDMHSTTATMEATATPTATVAATTANRTNTISNTASTGNKPNVVAVNQYELITH